jgi:hypothetical protein
MKILDDSVNSPSIRESLRIDLPQVLPPGECRNAVYDANLAAHFIAGPVNRAQYLAQISAEQKVRERPLCSVAATHEQELDRMAKIIRQRQVLNERIGVIGVPGDGSAKGGSNTTGNLPFRRAVPGSLVSNIGLVGVGGANRIIKSAGRVRTRTTMNFRCGEEI